MIHKCDYCGGFTDETQPLDHVNVAFGISNAARGQRNMCALCLIDMMDWVMSEIKRERRRHG